MQFDVKLFVFVDISNLLMPLTVPSKVRDNHEFMAKRSKMKDVFENTLGSNFFRQKRAVGKGLRIKVGQPGKTRLNAFL
jgi:hypothetical protein